MKKIIFILLAVFAFSCNNKPVARMKTPEELIDSLEDLAAKKNESLTMLLLENSEDPEPAIVSGSFNNYFTVIKGYRIYNIPVVDYYKEGDTLKPRF